MKLIYLFLAIVGAVVPYVFFFDFISVSGLDVPAFVAAAFANGAAGGFTADLLISSLVFWIFMYQRRRDQDGPGLLLFVVLNLTIGLSCALPAYLFAVERQKTQSDG